MKINRSGGARRSSGRPPGEPKKAIGHRVLVRFHAQLVQYLKEKEQELLKNKNNMENILNLETKKSVRIGQFTIYELTKLSVFIQHESGEGAEFSIEEFEKAVKLFYQTNF